MALRDREVVLMRLILEQMEARRQEFLGRPTPAPKRESEMRDCILDLKAEIQAARKSEDKERRSEEGFLTR